MSETSMIFLVFFIYVLCMVGIGYFFLNKNESIDDFIIGKRSLSPWVASMSAQASDMSGWLFTTLPGLAFISAAGSKRAVWTAIGLTVGTYLNWLLVAKRLRLYSEATNNSMTIPEYFENRFHDTKGILRLICAAFILFFCLLYTSSMFVAGAKLFTAIFDIPYLTALLIGGIVIVSYTVTGGFWAVSWTDFIQGALMLGALIVVPLVLLFGGFVNSGAAFECMRSGLTELGPIEGFDLAAILAALAMSLGYFGQPHILTRFMGINSALAVKKARRISMLWVIIAMLGALTVGMVGKIYYTGGFSDPETVFMWLVIDMFPPVISGLLLLAILAAVMSTADSQLLVAASAFSNDIFRRLSKNASQPYLLWLSRVSVLAVAIAALMLAADPQNSVLGLLAYSWAGFGAAFGPAMLLSLFWKRMNLHGAYAGILSGGFGAILLKTMGKTRGILSFGELLPAFILSAAAIVVCSCLTAPPDESITTQFELMISLKDTK